MSLSFTYGAGTAPNIDYTAGVTAIASSLGRTMTFTSGIGLDAGNTATTSGVTSGTAVLAGSLQRPR